MPTDLTTTLGAGLATLLTVLAIALMAVRWRGDGGAAGRAERALVLGVAAICLGLLAYRTIGLNRAWEPLRSHVDGLLLLGGVVAAVLGYLQWVGRLRGTELFALPLLALVLGWAVCASWWSFELFTIRTVWDGLHILAIYIALAAVALAGVLGGTYLYIQRQLRRKDRPGDRIRALGRLASLEAIEEWMLRAATAGFVLVSLALVVGVVQVTGGGSRLGDPWWAEPKVIGGVLIWIVLGLVVHVRFTPQFRGSGAAALSLSSLLLMLAVLAMALIGTG